jgi:hypothetical protein
MGVHNPGKHQHVDGCCLGAQQRPRASIDRGAGGQDIVDQDHAASLDPMLPVGRDLEGPWTLLARCDRDRPICCWVGRTRRSASEATFTPVCRWMARASAPDWL